ncbi:extracellular solute-binding protein [Isoptericola cucumis]|uniref:Sugar ABC transporter substrate-binding protein n=1 Tax=Isoptericola cucumis TaxID=1776856 RepID=A0ABQ2B9Q3_9MICO|nr:extracellular solute-binding protein [Isoptericola cucumis]GGI08583.1 sugar ABC transporter substrate-binding protein [Isoptericola cucumis]
MHPRRRTAAALSVATAAALVLSGCGALQDEPEETGPDTDLVMWLVGTDTGPELREHLVQAFEQQHPGATLTIEEQDWGDLVERLSETLGDPELTPDVVEIGNTQSPAFTTAGAFREISPALYEELGGDDLLQSFVEAGSVDGHRYALPYYFGSRYVFYRKDVWDAAGLEVPRTLAEFGESVVTLTDDRAAGFAMGGQDWRNGISWVFAHGGELAVKDGGSWRSTLADPRTVEGLRMWQEVYDDASYLPSTEKDVEYWHFLNDGVEGRPPAAATIMAPAWARWSIGDLVRGDDGAEVRDGMADRSTFGVFALPGVDGGVAPVFAGGSNVAISATTPSPELAEDVLRVVFSDEYQTMLAEAGLGPARGEFTDLMMEDVFGRTLVRTAAASKLTPAAPGWAAIEEAGVYEDLFARIAEGEDVEALAAEFDARLTPMLNRSALELAGGED